MNAATLLDTLCSRYRTILGSNFVGMYVHGSYAMGSFNPLKSDLDYIIVCISEPDSETKKCIMDTTIAFERFGPAKGLEMHLMRRCDCEKYEHPPYFCLHYSGAHTQAYLSDPDIFVSRMHGRDMDLGAHLTVLTNRGYCVCGSDIADVFGPVPEEAYIESVLSDLGWSEGDCMYHVLNRCRTLAYIADGNIRSKAEGAKWALDNIETERWHSIIRDAFECCISDAVMSDVAGAEEFCRAADEYIGAHIGKTTN